MAKMRNKNGYGTVVKLSGKRRKPYEVRVNTRMDNRNYPVYDVLGRYADRMEAQNALAAFNIDPYDIEHSKLTFSELYELYYNDKYNGTKQYSYSSKMATSAAYKRCTSLYSVKIADIKVNHLQRLLDNPELSHAAAEHLCLLFKQMFSYAAQYDYIKKDYSQYIKVNKIEDDKPGIAFTHEEIELLWKAYNNNFKNIDLVLILIYSGWRIKEFATCSIDFNNKTMSGGVKTKAGKDRTIPIHSKIYNMLLLRSKELQGHTNQYYNKILREAIQEAGIITSHSCHDCRHTFVSLLSSAGVPDISIKRLAGHANKDITGRYTHKEIEELRKELEKI